MNGSKVVTIAYPEDRSCSTCNCSWVLPPTSREVKEGIIDDQTYCCHAQVKFELNGEIFPRLTSRSRDRIDLCGPKGKLWQPIRVMIAKNFNADGTSVRNRCINMHRAGPTTHSEHKRREEVKTQSQQRVRKPYTV